MTREEAKHIDDVAFCVPQAVRRAGEDRTYHEDEIREAKNMAIKALEQEPKTRWNNHQIACMLADLFGDVCACNYNGIDEWLGELCDFKDTCCPNPVGVACWEQFLKYSQSRYTECGYEVRDKNALQEPKTGHWIDEFGGCECSECGCLEGGYSNYCPNCGAKMTEIPTDCSTCILDNTDACTRGAGRAIDDEACEDYLGAESEDKG